MANRDYFAALWLLQIREVESALQYANKRYEYWQGLHELINELGLLEE